MTNKAKAASVKDGKEFLRENFKDVQHVLSAHLALSARSITHDGTMGAVNEQHWIDLFRQYLPKRYACDSGIVIDSSGGVSDQMDIVIYDPQYTPTLLTQQSHRYIPAEAVYAVFEAKPTINRDYLRYAGDKAASVRRLKRTSAAITSNIGTHKPREPFPIIAGIVASKVDWADGFGVTFRSALSELQGDNRIDCGCGLSAGSFDQFATDGTLRLGELEHGLMFFLFRLLGKLQSLGTVTAIDWDVYAAIFASKVIEPLKSA